MKKKLLLSFVVLLTASFFYFNLETENKTAQLKKIACRFLKKPSL